MTTLGIYVQVPFCQTKCTYCNFHTGVVATSRFTPYIDAVCLEIRGYRSRLSLAGISLPLGANDWTVDTVYVGGGTPSLLEPVLLEQTLGVIRESFPCEFREVTLEADPETITEEKAHRWAAAGVNRVSFGLQSFNDTELIAAGRMHRRADIYRSIPILRDAGIQNISVDLIAGLPHQTAKTWRDSLDELTQLHPEHISIYLLEVDAGSRLGLEILQGGNRYSAGKVPTDDEMASFYEAACTVLESSGYHHYEISNWGKPAEAGKPGFESQHNLKYWRRKPYLGFGAGAHSFAENQRWANVHDAARYVEKIERGETTIEQQEILTKEKALEEEFFLGLRQLDGIDIGRIEREYGIDVDARYGELERAGHLLREGNTLRLAPGVLSVSNEILVEMMG